MNNYQFFDVDLDIKDNRDVRGIILYNKIKIILISDKDINKSSCAVGVRAGYLQDNFPGTAHFLEHLLFMGSDKFPKQNEYSSYIISSGGTYNAFTADNMTMYFLELESNFLKKGIEMLSWFFAKPLLNMKNIESELEIINSEHEKNLLNDNWIIDDLFKHFILPSNKYNKFGTGNSESLKGITKEDIMKFYNTYYTTCNMSVCIIDSKSIDEMIKDYVVFFSNIESKIYLEKSDRFKKEKLSLIPQNLIIFKSVTEYNFLNFNLVFEANERDQTDYQLINILCWLIGTEYNKSIYFYLKENDIIKDLVCSLDYFFDYEAIINLKFIVNEANLETINTITNSFNNLLNKLVELKEKDFKELYLGCQKINIINCMYSDNTKDLDYAVQIVENLLKGEPQMALLRNFILPTYNHSIYLRFIEIINTLIIKLITNIHFIKKKFLKTKWYNTDYFIDNYKFSNSKNKLINEFDYDFKNIIGIKDFNIKTDLVKPSVDKKLLPKLIDKNDSIKREIYYLESNKYNTPIGNITVIRQNYLLNDKKNKVLLSIFLNICLNILNYYLEVMDQYKMYFNVSINSDKIIYNFYGLNYIINNFIFEILKRIDPDTVFNNPNTLMYFNKIIRDNKDAIKNLKYELPYARCSQTLSTLFLDLFLPDEQLDFLNSLTFDDFKKNVQQCLKYQNETFIIVGIPNLLLNNKTPYSINNDIKYLIDALSLSPERYLLNDSKNKITNIPYKLSYKFNPTDINKKEKNNCLIQNFIVNIIGVQYKNNVITLDSIHNIIKNKLICSIVSSILHEYFFDKVRTEDKLGYIIKCNSTNNNIGNNYVFVLYYLVQSNFKIDDIKKSFNNFNKFIIQDIKKNKNKYDEIFLSIIKSKKLIFEKPFVDLQEEISTYAKSFVDDYNLFNINDVVLYVISNIKFKDIYDTINKICSGKTKSSYVIFETNK